jgi:hypothetical protein
MRLGKIENISIPIDPYILRACLNQYTREELRDIAKEINVPRGRNKADTIQNLIDHKERWEVVGSFALYASYQFAKSFPLYVTNRYAKQLR